MIDKSAYLLRISQASPAGLVVITLELIVEFLNNATKEDFYGNIQKAKEGLEQLIQALDFAVPLSHDFYQIYSYAYKLLCDVHFSSDKEMACKTAGEVAELMEMLLVGWRDCAEKNAEAAEAAESPKVYTGLTYGKDGQANEYIQEDKDRGYMA
ncbi:MAG: flagellar protein FliS [Defluviitaleaceae bacterium]|nr:flagellar protein FliS [Defluviitaleaceae bacterium]